MKARTWAAGLLPIGMLLAIGCGSPPNPSATRPSKAEPAAANIPNAPTSPGTAPAADPSPAPEPVKPAYELDPAKHAIPAARVVGVAGGAAFSPLAVVEDDSLVFRTFKSGTTVPDRQIRIKLGTAANAKSFDGRKLVVGRDVPPGPDVPEVYVDSAAGLHLYPNGYALTLELGRRQNWTIPGKIYLCLPDAEQTVLAGGFEAAYQRQPGEPPGPEDLPFIAGSVKLVGGPAKAVLRVGYFVDERPGVFHLASADLALGDPTAAIGSVRVEWDKPRITTLLVGDGKAAVAQYEHSRLTTGRYLVYAMLEPNGPVASSWVTVLPGETHTADLIIDAGQTGGVEVNAPREAVKDVRLMPADKPGFSLIEPSLFIAAADQLKLVQPIVAGKVVFRNLTPGRYHVQSSNGETRDIEIVAGKTVELDFDKPALPVPKTGEPKTEPKK